LTCASITQVCLPPVLPNFGHVYVLTELVTTRSELIRRDELEVLG